MIKNKTAIYILASILGGCAMVGCFVLAVVFMMYFKEANHELSYIPALISKIFLFGIFSSAVILRFVEWRVNKLALKKLGLDK